MSTEVPAKDRIRMWNDHLRQLHRGGKVLMTRGIAALDPTLQQRIVTAVSSFNALHRRQ